MKKEDKIYLQRLEFGDETQILDMISKDEELKDTFSGGNNTISRLMNSIYSAIIKKGNQDVGFVMIVNNEKTDTNEIDMGILKQYRSKGYGTEALRILKQIIIENELDIEIQIKKLNIGAIKSVINNGFVLTKEKEECNYYGIERKR